MALRSNWFLIALAFLAMSFWTTLAWADTLNQDIQHKLERFRRIYKVPGIVMSIRLPHENIPRDFISGVDRVPKGKRLTKDHLFQIGSISKSFTAALLLKLEARGLVSLNDRVGIYLPQYPKWRYITIRQLLNHTSGIYDYTLDPRLDHIKNRRYCKTSWSFAQLTNMAYRHPPYFAAGQGWHYSNTNYILAGMIIEKITHRTMAQNIHDYILDPKLYGLASTYYVSGFYPSVVLLRMAHGYHLYGGRDQTYVNLSWAGSAGAIVSNSHDLIKWVHSLFHGKVLPPRQLQEMKTITSQKDGSYIDAWSSEKGYGLGISHRYVPNVGIVWSHPGGTTGFSALFMWAEQQDLTIAITANSHSVNIKRLNAFGANILQTILRHEYD